MSSDDNSNESDASLGLESSGIKRSMVNAEDELKQLKVASVDMSDREDSPGQNFGDVVAKREMLKQKRRNDSNKRQRNTESRSRSVSKRDERTSMAMDAEK